MWLKETEIFYASLHENGKKDMLDEVHVLLEEADVVIHYNGTRFDIPTLNQEFLDMNMGAPATFQQIDLLKTARNRFRLPSNSLNYVSRFLGVGSKVKHKGMELWRDCMAGDDKAWAVMKRYNIGDITLLEKVYNKFLPWIANHPNFGLFMDTNEQVCPNCGSTHTVKRGFYYTKTMRYQRYKCKACGSWSKSRTTNLPIEKRKAILTGIK